MPPRQERCKNGHAYPDARHVCLRCREANAKRRRALAREAREEAYVARLLAGGRRRKRSRARETKHKTRAFCLRWHLRSPENVDSKGRCRECRKLLGNAAWKRKLIREAARSGTGGRTAATPTAASG